MQNNYLESTNIHGYWKFNNHDFSNIQENICTKTKLEQSDNKKATILKSIITNHSNWYPSSEFNSKPKFHYINALAGSGKTHGALEYALKMASAGEKVLIAQPTIKLIEESYDNAENLNTSSVHISRIHSESNSNGSTQSELMEYLKQPAPDLGEILFVTHKSFFSIPYFHNGVMRGGFVRNIFNKAVIRFLYIKVFTLTQNLIITS